MADDTLSLFDGLGRDLQEPDPKWCHACRATHFVSDFGKDRTRPDGLRAICREADRRIGRARQAKKSGDNYHSWYATAPEGFITRREALAQGLKEYFDGRPCAQGHISPKRVDSYSCTECHKDIAKRWEAKGPSHPERLEAIKAKSSTFVGKSCPKGHNGLRLVRNGRCAHCTRARVGVWRQAHPEYDATGKTRERRRKDPTKHRAGVARWKAKNPETAAALLHRWKKANPERVRQLAVIGGAKRRARKTEAGGSFTATDIQNMMDEQDGHCAACGKVPDKFHIDHIMPVVLGGSSNPINLMLLCPKCNRSKGSKHPEIWRASFRCYVTLDSVMVS